MKWRNSKERELLASGGSRDQTLPNKNNPNPDLSDARTDRQPSLSPTSPSPSSPVLDQVNLTPNVEQFNSNSGPIKSNDGRKSMTSADSNGKGDKLFKMEYEESRSAPQQQLFSNFYEKVRDINNSLAFTGRTNHMSGAGNGSGNVNASTGSGSNPSTFYYDEYDSHSDSDEEISVT